MTPEIAQIIRGMSPVELAMYVGIGGTVPRDMAAAAEIAVRRVLREMYEREGDDVAEVLVTLPRAAKGAA